MPWANKLDLSGYRFISGGFRLTGLTHCICMVACIMKGNFVAQLEKNIFPINISRSIGHPGRKKNESRALTHTLQKCIPSGSEVNAKYKTIIV